MALSISTVHRIGRTGRCKKTGVATTFINRNCSEIILRDLKHLLREANQKIPPVLESLPDPVEQYQEVGGVKGMLLSSILSFGSHISRAIP
jgi:ATP-dependent RNA helicase DDX41